MTWVFLRGLTRTQYHWLDFVEIFQKEIKHKVICIDLPGFGDHVQDESPKTIKGILEFVRSKLAREPYRVLGISLGGMVALEWAYSYPKEVEKLVVVNSSAGNLNPFYERLKIKNYSNLFKILFSKNLREKEKRVLELTLNIKHEDIKILDSYSDLNLKYKPKFINVLHQMIAARRFILQKNPVPTLVLASQADDLVDVKCSKEISKFLGAELKIHPSAGHDLPLDDPYFVIDEIKKWLK